MCEYLVPISRTGWEGLGGVVLLRGHVSQGGWALKFQKTQAIPILSDSCLRFKM